MKVSEAEFARLWRNQSLTLAEIGQRIGGVQYATVSARARRRGLPPRLTGPAPAIHDDAAFCQMWRAGVSGPKIAAHFGVHINTVDRHVRRLGLVRRR